MNQIFTCFKGEKGSFEGDNNQDTQKKGGKGERSSKKSKTGKLPPGFNEAAETLGISGETEDKLKAALPSKP